MLRAQGPQSLDVARLGRLNMSPVISVQRAHLEQVLQLVRGLQHGFTHCLLLAFTLSLTVLYRRF